MTLKVYGSDVDCIDSEDGGRNSLRNVDNYLPLDTALCSGTLKTSTTSLWEAQFSSDWLIQSWTLNIVSGVFNAHDVLSVGLAFASRWEIVIVHFTCIVIVSFACVYFVIIMELVLFSIYQQIVNVKILLRY